MNRLSFISRALAVSLAVLTTGCKTTSMSKIQPIPITAGVKPSGVIQAIVFAAHHIKIPERRLPPGPIKSYEDGHWTVEDTTDRSVILCYSISQHSVRVRYEIEDQYIVPKVISSNNLKQGKRRIHRNAVVWINRLAPDISEAMWRVKTFGLAAGAPTVKARDTAPVP